MQGESIHEASSLMCYISDAVGSIRDPQELFRTVTDKLRLVFEFDSAVIITFDRDRRYINVFFEMLRFEFPDTIQRKKRPVAGSWIEPHLGDTTVSVMTIEGEVDRYPADFPVPKMLYELGMRQVVLSPLRSGGKVIGFLNFVSKHEKSWSEDEKELLSTLSSPIAVAVSNALAYEELRQREAQTAMQLAVNNALLTIRDRSRMMLAVCEQIDRLVPCSFLGIRVMGSDGDYRVFDNFMKEPGGGFSPVLSYDQLEVSDFHEIAKESFALITNPGCYAGDDFDRLARQYRLVSLVREKLGVCSVISVALWDSPGSRAGLIISSTSRSFDENDLQTVSLVVPQLSLALQNYLAYEEIDDLRRRLEGERTWLIEEIKGSHDFEEIIGRSAPLAGVLRRVSQVAPTDATVLIQGETGTGKELFARAIHNLSPRREKMMVKVNCAALPAALIESELFGHEKGSFTGATERRIGKFELAAGGTIFLDEIGELPIELQAKLLRVLQERELERIGGSRVIPVDVRVIAATNRDLEREVAEGRFREDLYFRLNVFPLAIPPLRERGEDIPLLAAHFASKFAREFGRPQLPFRENDLLRLQGRAWKGNIRELAHLVEQAVIVSDGPSLDITSLLSPEGTAGCDRCGVKRKTMHDFSEEMLMLERELILDALDRSGGRVSGQGGAAELLEMHPKTLYSRIDKLGMRKRYS
ncbi:MAG: sigma 54-interacting transcriptional regulator [Chlorobi bacterium]|nr:sigma 54-interacting transcriptional regulator [Chlorobiota bacterium]